jgi:hypothetical protein
MDRDIPCRFRVRIDHSFFVLAISPLEIARSIESRSACRNSMPNPRCRPTAAAESTSDRHPQLVSIGVPPFPDPNGESTIGNDLNLRQAEWA